MSRAKIDLLVDKACAKLTNEITSKPTMLDEIDRRIIQMKMDQLSVRSDAESSSDSRKNAGKINY